MTCMSSRPYSTRLNQLIALIENHPNRKEILRLAEEQMIDDFEYPKNFKPNHL
ncbi:hypothetical protein EV06_1507 [Prochlorococcus sp. MIT 0602]|nr:hypothetical protein EV06_1507 [Prochlorococcus sp. MIT 0602]KGG17168.1 hypothetical protein EV07_0603 [Prochlorococcus sp. MIT 0603]